MTEKIEDCFRMVPLLYPWMIPVSDRNVKPLKSMKMPMWISSAIRIVSEAVQYLYDNAGKSYLLVWGEARWWYSIINWNPSLSSRQYGNVMLIWKQLWSILNERTLRLNPIKRTLTLLNKHLKKAVTQSKVLTLNRTILITKRWFEDSHGLFVPIP